MVYKRQVRTWGGNGTGQLGDGTTVARSTPITPIRVSDVVQIAAGGFMTYARRSDGSVMAWGLSLIHISEPTRPY